jgi:hypothetical protein
MVGLFSESDKDEIRQSFKLLHDTFGREVFIYKDAKKIIVSSDSTFNSVYGLANNGTQSVEYEPVQQSIKARIIYGKQQNESNFPGTSVNAELSEGEVKITVTKEDYNNFVKDAKRAEIDGEKFIFISDPRPQGMFGPDYYSFMLRRAQ